MLVKAELWRSRQPLFSRTATFTFQPDQFRDAVVMPSYRNQGKQMTDEIRLTYYLIIFQYIILCTIQLN